MSTLVHTLFTKWADFALPNITNGHNLHAATDMLHTLCLTYGRQVVYIWNSKCEHSWQKYVWLDRRFFRRHWRQPKFKVALSFLDQFGPFLRRWVKCSKKQSIFHFAAGSSSPSRCNGRGFTQWQQPKQVADVARSVLIMPWLEEKTLCQVYLGVDQGSVTETVYMVALLRTILNFGWWQFSRENIIQYGIDLLSLPSGMIL